MKVIGNLLPLIMESPLEQHMHGSEMKAKKCGGAKRIKVTEQHVEKVIEYVSENPLITLKKFKIRY